MILAFKTVDGLKRIVKEYPGLEVFPILSAILNPSPPSGSKCVPPLPPVTSAHHSDGFYLISLPHDDFESLRVSGELDDLASYFPETDLSLIETTWETSHTWGACFDIILMLVQSQDRLLLERAKFSHLPLDKIPLLWLPNFPISTEQGTFVTIEENSLEEGHRWSVSICSKIASDIHLPAMDGNISADDWEIVDHNFQEMVLEESGPDDIVDDSESKSSSSVSTGTETSGKVTYRDMVIKGGLAPQHDTRGAGVSFASRSTKPSWKPTFVVTKTSIASRRAGHFDIVDEEEDGFWDLIESHARSKIMTGITRHRATTMLTPQAQEKKNQRILEKAQAQTTSA